MVILNADWERKSVPGAIGELVRDLMVRRTRFSGRRLGSLLASDTGQVQRRGRAEGASARRTKA